MKAASRNIIALLFFAPVTACTFAGSPACKPSDNTRPECVSGNTAPARRVQPPPVQSSPGQLPPAAIPNAPRVPPPPEPAKPAAPPPPAVTTTCDPGGCWDTNANRYNRGAGSVHQDSKGKTCVRNGVWMQCF